MVEWVEEVEKLKEVKMATIRSFEDAKIWKESRILVNQIYDISESKPFDRDFALRNQIRRAALSVMSNIAEGFESQTNKMFYSYLSKSKASAGEVRSQLYIVKDRGYINDDEFVKINKRCKGLSVSIYNLMEYLGKDENIHKVRDTNVGYS